MTDPTRAAIEEAFSRAVGTALWIGFMVGALCTAIVGLYVWILL